MPKSVSDSGKLPGSRTDSAFSKASANTKKTTATKISTGTRVSNATKATHATKVSNWTKVSNATKVSNGSKTSKESKDSKESKKSKHSQNSNDRRLVLAVEKAEAVQGAWLDIMPAEVIATLDKLRTAQEDRKRQQITQQLSDIHSRLAELYQHAGVSCSIHPSDSEAEVTTSTQHRPPTYESDKERRSRKHQKAVLEFIIAHVTRCNNRLALLRDLKDWFNSITIEDDLKSTRELNQFEDQFEAICRSIETTLWKSQRADKRLEEFTMKMMADAGYLDDDDDPMMKKGKFGLPPTVIYEAKQMLENSQYFHEAVTEVRRILNDAIRLVRNNNGKSMLRGGLKQFKNIMMACERNTTHMEHLEELMVENEQRMAKLSQTNDVLASETRTQRAKIDETDKQLKMRGVELDQVRQERNDLSRQVTLLEDANETLQNKVLNARTSSKSIRSRHHKSSACIAKLSPIEASPRPLSKSSIMLTESKESLNNLTSEESIIIMPPTPQTPEYNAVTNENRVESQLSSSHSLVTTLKTELMEYQHKISVLEKYTEDLKKRFRAERDKTTRLEAKLSAMKAHQASDYSGNAKKQSFHSDHLSVDSDSRLELISLQDENEALHRQLSDLSDVIRSKDDLIESQEKRISSFHELVDVLVTNEKHEKVATSDGKSTSSSSQNSQKKKKITIRSGSENTSSVGSSESNKTVEEMKRYIGRMKKSYEHEIARLKLHVDKEKSRHEAALRKLEAGHKDELSSVYKESVHLLRAINRFKECIAVMMEKEGLTKAMTEIQDMTNLATEHKTNNAKLLLCQMAGQAVELLVNIETQLGQALMDRRLEIKDNSMARNFAHKDLEMQIESANRVRIQNDLLQEKVVSMRNQLATMKDEKKLIKQRAHDKYTALFKRYQKVWKQYTSSQTQYDKLRDDFAQISKNKDLEYQRMLRIKENMIQIIERQSAALQKSEFDKHEKRTKAERKFQMTMHNLKRNLEILKEALRENKITVEMHSMAREIMQNASHVPAIRFRYMIERYVIYKRLTSIRSTVMEYLREILNPTERSRELVKIVENIDERLAQLTKNWQRKQNDLEIERRTLMGDACKLFTEMMTIEPVILQRTKKMTIADDRISSSGKRMNSPEEGCTDVSKFALNSGNPFTMNRDYRLIDRMHSDEQIFGRKLAPFATTSVMELPHFQVTPQIQIPKLLDMDVNSNLQKAKKTLRRAKQSYPMHTAEGYTMKKERLSLLCRLPQTSILPGASMDQMSLHVVLPQVTSGDSMDSPQPMLTKVDL